jgi:hypothetical protein
MQMISFITWLVFHVFPSKKFATSQQAFSATSIQNSVKKRRETDNDVLNVFNIQG